MVDTSRLHLARLMTAEQIDDIVEDVDIMASCLTEYEDDVKRVVRVREMGEVLKRYIAAFEKMSAHDIREVEAFPEEIQLGYLTRHGT